MGNVNFSHFFEHHDWRKGVEELQARAIRNYGEDPYNGTISTVNNISLHRPSRSLKTESELWEYLQQRLNYLNSREGEVIDLGVVGYIIAKPVITRWTQEVPNFDPSIFKRFNTPAVMYNGRGFTGDVGTVAELKKKAERLIVTMKFKYDYFIVGRTGTVYICTGEGKTVKSTQRKSTPTSLVLENHRWVVYGWAKE